jgi:flagellar secretion chaperone FliS
MAVGYEDAYLESRVYSATPAELVQILYEAALQSVSEALDAEAQPGLDDVARITARARGISRASSCVMELAGSLNVQAGGELGVRLAVLYEYLLHELLEATTGRDTQPLRNAQRVLSALLEGWSRAVEQIPPDETGAEVLTEAGAETLGTATQIPADPEGTDEEYASTGTASWSA